MEANNELLDWVERSALENIRAHIKSANDIKRESGAALTIVIAGAGGSLAYAARAFEMPVNIAIAFTFSVISIYLFALCAILVVRCLRVGAFPSPTNEPKHLNQREYSLNRLREVELRNMQKRIEAAARINESRSRWLNGVWIAATATPIVAVAAFSLACLGRGLF